MQTWSKQPDSAKPPNPAEPAADRRYDSPRPGPTPAKLARVDGTYPPHRDGPQATRTAPQSPPSGAICANQSSVRSAVRPTYILRHQGCEPSPPRSAKHPPESDQRDS